MAKKSSVAASANIYAREALPNGTLWLGAFSAAQYRSDVHAAVYRCRAAGTVGTVLSRDMRLEAGGPTIFEEFPRFLQAHSNNALKR
ncbi:jg20121 [Pararge aegeria aegeria]|uniref:Jg20121 protein n=1 Tax=Pararge aegeria aegeria TaxID=348720 RepID=A0A8S4RA23_9NEOP|nr:jg20121 [Pararge aegeria aegeria]